MSRNPDLSILIFDDDQVDRLHLRDLLEADFSLQEASTADQAQRLIEHSAPDCILLDYHIPGTDTLQLLQDWSGRDAAVVILTGKGDETTAVEAMKRGASDYMSKGNLTTQSVARAVRNAVEKARLRHQLNERQRELESFVSVASHDLRAPLRRIGQFGKLVENGCRQGDQDTVRRYMQYILDSIDQMDRLVERLREYSRAGRPPGSLGALDLNRVLRQAQISLQTEISAAQARITSDPLPTVLGDPVRLAQLFQNLLANAIKYQPDHPPQVHISARRVDGRWQVAVRDNGIGIAPEHHERIFAPFKRLHNQSEYEGSGIGLATCGRIVKQHEGKLWVQSALGEGTTFFFTLAPAPEAPSARPAAPPPPSDRRAFRLLLADDDAVNRLTAAAALKRLGHSVTAVADGQKALAALREDRFDALLLDIEMPVMDGRETAAYIRADERQGAGRLPIVALTGHGDALTSADLDAVLSKPLDVNALQNALESLVRPSKA